MAWSNLSIHVLILVSVLIVSVCADMAFLSKTCSETQHNDVCLTMMLSAPGGINCSDIRCAVSAGANVALNYARNTSSFIERSRGQAPDEDAFKFCATLYGSVDNSVKDAIDSMGSQDYGGAKETLGTAREDPDKCEAAFQSHPNKMTTSNQRMGDLLDVLWEFLDQITS